MSALPPDPDWYLEHVLLRAEPGRVERSPDTSTTRWQDWWAQRLQDTDQVVCDAAGSGFVLDAAQLTALGISRQRARTLVRRGAWTGVGRGHVAPLAAPPTARHWHALDSAAAVRRRGRDVVSGRSAAVLHGLPTVAVPTVPETTIRPRPVALGRTAHGHRFGARLAVGETTTWFGVPVTSVGRTLVDLGRHDRFDAIMAVDAALRSRSITGTDVQSALRTAAGWPGVRQAREVLLLGTDLAESPLESITRLRLHADGFPEPQLQAVLAGYRVDFYWPQLRLVLEADGRSKYTDDALWQEKRRETVLRRLGLRIERVTWSDVMRDWSTTSDWLSRLFPLPRAIG